MKTLAKLTLAAMTLALTTTAFAGDLTLVRTDNGHGSFLYHFRPAETTATIAVYTHDRGLGQSTMQMDDTAIETRLVMRDNGHGTMVPHFVPVTK